ncbi:unnamed protein product, partial [Porites lobata]
MFNATVSKVNKLLGPLKLTCPQLTTVSVRWTLYLFPVKSQLCQSQSESQSHLQGKIERVERRTTRWILRSRIGEMSCKERLIRLDMQTDLNVHNFVSFVTHGQTRQSNSFKLKISFRKTSAFKASYFNRIVKLRTSL